MNRPSRLITELHLIVIGIGHELLRIVGLAFLVPRPKNSTRVIASTITDATGGLVQVVGKDSKVPNRYVVQREDGSLFTLAKATLLRRRK